MEHGVSVIVCCYNSVKRISSTIAHLANQVVDPECKWEIILVDNLSTDGTAEFANKEWQSYNSNTLFKVVKENKPGLNFARLTGIKESRYSYVLLCDDDNWLDRAYVSNGYNILKKNPKIGVLGGLPSAEFGGQEPSWFKSYQQFYAVGSQAHIQGNVSDVKPWIYGAGMFINRKAIEGLENYTFLTTDRKGKSLASGGDIEICYYVLSRGFLIWYDEVLKFKHFIEASRLNLDYLKRMMVSGAEAAYKLDGLRHKATRSSQRQHFSQKWLIRFVLDNLKAYKHIFGKQLPAGFLFKLHLIRMTQLLKMNFKYDKSFKV